MNFLKIPQHSSTTGIFSIDPTHYFENVETDSGGLDFFKAVDHWEYLYNRSSTCFEELNGLKFPVQAFLIRSKLEIFFFVV